MQATNLSIRQHQVELESLALDETLFNRIAQDLADHAGTHAPAQVWLDAGGSGGAEASDFDAKNLIFPWIGFGKNPIAAESLSWHYQFIKDIDVLGLAERYFDSATTLKPAAEGLLIADLGTMMDMNLMAPHLPERDAATPLRVIEVGGGYGRLTEAMFNVFEGKLKYVMIDAVPASMIFAYEFLSRALPNVKIGSFYRGDAYDLDQFDIYICPIWHFETAGAGQFDLGINVQSMQEMDQHHVDFYINWFDSVLKTDGVAYLCNRRDHVFRGQWNYPDHWQCLLKICTPRSWLRDFPAEVFRKGERSYAAANAQHEALYQRQLRHADSETVAAGQAAGYRVY